MDLDEKTAKQFDELEELGKQVLQTEGEGGTYSSDLDDAQAERWGTRTQSFLARLTGGTSYYTSNFRTESKVMGSGYRKSTVKKGMGILAAARDDFEGGYLYEVRTLIEAEVFSDFLEQAEHLLEAGYEGPAAVIAGSVLEDGLHKLCSRNEIELPDIAKLDWMNAQLAKEGVYNKLVQKQITAAADLRNKAAHGHWDEFTAKDVELMISQVLSFMGTHFA